MLARYSLLLDVISVCSTKTLTSKDIQIRQLYTPVLHKVAVLHKIMMLNSVTYRHTRNL